MRCASSTGHFLCLGLETLNGKSGVCATAIEVIIDSNNAIRVILPMGWADRLLIARFTTWSNFTGRRSLCRCSENRLLRSHEQDVESNSASKCGQGSRNGPAGVSVLILIGRTVAPGPKRSLRSGNLELGFSNFGAVGSRPRVLNAVDHGNGRENGNHPQDRSHAIEQSADDNQDQALGSLHEADSTGADERLRASAAVADHDGTHDHISSENDIEEPPAASVENEQAKELGGIAVAVNHRVKERAKAGNAILRASHFAVHQIKEAGADDDQSCVEEHALLIFRGGIAEEERGPGIHYESHEGEDIGINLG